MHYCSETQVTAQRFKNVLPWPGMISSVISMVLAFHCLVRIWNHSCGDQSPPPTTFPARAVAVIFLSFWCFKKLFSKALYTNSAQALRLYGSLPPRVIFTVWPMPALIFITFVTRNYSDTFFCNLSIMPSIFAISDYICFEGIKRVIV